MGTRKSKLLRRRAAQSYHHLETSLMYIMQLHNEFEGHHSELDQVLVAIAKLMITTQDMIKAFWEKAWGPFPEDYRTYF